MHYLADWCKFTENNEMNSKLFVDKFYLKLKKMVPNSESLADEEIYNKLVKYFCEFPDQIMNLKISNYGNPKTIAIPILNNIGGVVKYL